LKGFTDQALIGMAGFALVMCLVSLLRIRKTGPRSAAMAVAFLAFAGLAWGYKSNLDLPSMIAMALVLFGALTADVVIKARSQPPLP